MTDSPEIPEITPGELKARIDAGEIPVLVDVREHFERGIADLPEHGQLRIPTAELLERLDEVEPAGPVVVYCRSGSRSAWAVRLMMGRGFGEVFNLKGGVLGWREEIDPSLRAY